MRDDFLMQRIKKSSQAIQSLRRRGRSGEIRTPGLMDPNHARYQLRYTPKYSIFLLSFRGASKLPHCRQRNRATPRNIALLRMTVHPDSHYIIVCPGHIVKENIETYEAGMDNIFAFEGGVVVKECRIFIFTALFICLTAVKL